MSVNVFDLTVRDAPVGGGVLPEVIEEPTVPPTQGLVLLIHGYQNTETAARASYRQFLDLATPDQLQRFGTVCRFYWPGDKNWGFVSFSSYPLEIAPARETAVRLYGFLTSRGVPGGWPLRVALVCHSLGNRVGLELMALLGTDSRFVVTMCLMAAAVPVHFVEPGGQLDAAVAALDRSSALYSKADTVLRWAFPPGETAALEGFFPSAVGREGHPLSSWTYQWRMDPYRHSDYWSGWRAAQKVLELLSVAVPRVTAANSIPPQQTPTSSTPIASGPARRATPIRK